MLQQVNYKPGFYKGINAFKIRRVLYIALFWTIVDVAVHLLNTDLSRDILLREVVIRSALVFAMSCIMGYLFVFSFRNIFANRSLLIHFIAKSALVILAAGIMNMAVYLVETTLFSSTGFNNAWQSFFDSKFSITWVIKRMLYWLIVFAVTQLFLEINDKYAPGIFLSILSGKYKTPQVENRIIMFMDLKDSTPIAEKLGHEDYFEFIKLFIDHLSSAIIVNGGTIYQYVGDEIVVSWSYKRKNTERALTSVIEARRNIQRAGEDFRRNFDVVPEFRVGIHAGEVTIGEIGIIKKDLAMSGDTMNTTARIRSACTDLNQKFIVSKAFRDYAALKEWQYESLGTVELKGKAEKLELYSLKI